MKRVIAMAKLYFYYSAMNAGKSTVLLQSAYNYKERGMDVLIFKPIIDTRYDANKVCSRIGLNANAITFDRDFDLFDYIKDEKAINPKLRCILLDEAHFLTKKQVLQLSEVVDQLDLPILTYGLRSDFKGEAFEGSLSLLILADNLVEIKTICYCGKKAIMSARIDESGHFIQDGEQTQIGGNESYVAMCRKHYKKSTRFRL
jgi:thymidine kinase